MAIQATGMLLDGCVLSLLSQEDAYGYSLTQQLKEMLGVSESTLYPVMRRLQAEGCLAVYEAPHNGRIRRYYQITDEGRKKYAQISEEWLAFVMRVDKVMVAGKAGKNYSEMLK